MRKFFVPILLVLFIFNSSWQCQECIDRPSTQLDDSRNWFPLKGKTAIDYVSSNGTPRSFSVKVSDTTYRFEQCVSKGSYYSYEYIKIQLLLDRLPDSICNVCYDDIDLNLGNVNDLYVTTFAGSPNPRVHRWYNVFSQAQNNPNIITLNNYRLNNTTYPQVILLKSADLNPLIDSIFLARNYGIAGFKYKGVRYTLP